IANAIAYNFNMLSLPTRHYNTAYFIWRKPYMAAGGDTFINAMLSAAGLKNAFAHMPRYPEVTLEHLTVNEVDLILLSSEPYPFKASHIAEIQTALPNAIIRLVDGEMFSWYGSRLLQTTAYLQRLLADL
ncbi:MAG TPA: cobalamin-binding protein, partial [Chitinophagaceae bacterium]|nr:cobalamin-binding protein [Chitinophagaceae bacterium]